MSHVTKEEWILPWLGNMAMFWGLIYFFAGVIYGSFIVKRITGKSNSDCFKIAAITQGVSATVAFYAIPTFSYLAFGMMIDMWMMAFINVVAGTLIDYCMLRWFFKTCLALKACSWLVLWNVGSLFTGVCLYLFACLFFVLSGAD